MPAVLPETPLSRTLGTAAAVLEKALGLTTAKDLLGYFPRDHMPHNALSDFAELREGELASFIAEVSSTGERRLQTRRGTVVDVSVVDEHGGSLTMGFFGGWEAKRRLRPGVRAMFQGKVRGYGARLTITNPTFEVLSPPDDQSHEEEAELEEDQILPIYPATAGLTSSVIRECVRILLDQTNFSQWPDPMPADISSAQQLPTLGEAYRMMHRPETMDEPGKAWYRFRLEEGLLLQGLMERRRRLTGDLPGFPAAPLEEGRLAAFDEQLEFTLTPGQRRCGELIAAGLAADRPMNRLLQGEVGSGKTLVALRAMLQVVDAGAQAALIAPTEVLAAQHERSLRRALGALADQTRTGLLASSEGPQPVRITVLTGSLGTAERKKALLEIASGQSDIVIGTHAVLGDKVEFAQLGLAVIDEQHRFGVEQRNALRKRYRPAPHLLVMSATPIPRSVAMTVFGDLELTVLEGLPGGRSPIETHVVPTIRGRRWKERVWERIAEEARAGRQVYVVCPRITAQERSKQQIENQLADRFGMMEGDQKVTLAARSTQGKVIHVDFTRQQAIEHITQDASVEVIERTFAEHPELKQLSCGTLHGRMHPADASEVMTAFESGHLQVLIATTVIEVGVDVPNATLMAVLDADAFGVSTLHQLRGRIGRGDTEHNQCLLVTRMPPEHPSMERLNEVARHTDGMELARLDLARRREGDILGAAQSGAASTLRLLRIAQDGEIIEQAGDYIRALSERDPQWSSAPGLLEAVEAWRLEHEDAEDYVHQG